MIGQTRAPYASGGEPLTTSPASFAKGVEMNNKTFPKNRCSSLCVFDIAIVEAAMDRMTDGAQLDSANYLNKKGDGDV